MQGQQFSGLDDLTSRHHQAGAYYRALPVYVKEQIGQRKEQIQSFESLRDYAENLLRGDQ